MKTTKKQNITEREFAESVSAVQGELNYQDALYRRTDDEANSILAFCTLLRRYLRKVEDQWSDNPADQPGGQVEEALHGLRKLAAIAVRSMIYCGVRRRSTDPIAGTSYPEQVIAGDTIAVELPQGQGFDHWLVVETMQDKGVVRVRSTSGKQVEAVVPDCFLRSYKNVLRFPAR